MGPLTHSGALMSLSDLASLGSFVSGIAVLASLVFLFFQMRQMTEQVRQGEKNQRAILNQGSLLGAEENIRWLSDPVMTDLRSRVTSGETAFTARELGQLRQFVRSQVIAVQDNYVQFRAGLADNMTFENGITSLKGLFAQPVFRAIWRSSRATYATEWAAYVDDLIRGLPLAKPADEVATFNAHLSEIMADQPAP